MLPLQVSTLSLIAAVYLLSSKNPPFTGSIRDNIVQGIEAGKEISNAEVEEACRSANAWDFISSLPEALNTPCGSSGGSFQEVSDKGLQLLGH